MSEQRPDLGGLPLVWAYHRPMAYLKLLVAWGYGFVSGLRLGGVVQMLV